MIAGGSLGISTVGVELLTQFRLKFLQCKGQPAVYLLVARQVCGYKQKSGNVGQIMVGSQFLIPLEVVDDVETVFVKTVCEVGPDVVVEALTVIKLGEQIVRQR